MTAFAALLDRLTLAAPQTAGPLTMVPLLAPGSSPADYLLLDDALADGLAEITEVSDTGHVPELRYTNFADRDTLLLDGEELVGAKQNRVLNLTILVPAGATVVIPVSCVEAGRWSWRSRRFASGERKLHARARRDKMAGVTAALRERGERADGAIQRQVWDAVDEKMAAFSMRSDTGALHDVYESASARLEALRSGLKAAPRQTGAAFLVNGRLAGLDLFDAPATLTRVLPKLIDSYAFDALEEDAAETLDPTAALEQVRALLARLSAAAPTVHPAIAKGTDLRIAEPGLQAAALADGPRIVHLSAFSEAVAGT